MYNSLLKRIGIDSYLFSLLQFYGTLLARKGLYKTTELYNSIILSSQKILERCKLHTYLL